MNFGTVKHSERSDIEHRFDVIIVNRFCCFVLLAAQQMYIWSFAFWAGINWLLSLELNFLRDFLLEIEFHVLSGMFIEHARNAIGRN